MFAEQEHRPSENSKLEIECGRPYEQLSRIKWGKCFVKKIDVTCEVSAVDG